MMLSTKFASCQPGSDGKRLVHDCNGYNGAHTVSKKQAGNKNTLPRSSNTFCTPDFETAGTEYRSTSKKTLSAGFPQVV